MKWKKAIAAVILGSLSANPNAFADKEYYHLGEKLTKEEFLDVAVEYVQAGSSKPKKIELVEEGLDMIRYAEALEEVKPELLEIAKQRLADGFFSNYLILREYNCLPPKERLINLADRIFEETVKARSPVWLDEVITGYNWVYGDNIPEDRLIKIARGYRDIKAVDSVKYYDKLIELYNTKISEEEKEKVFEAVQDYWKRLWDGNRWGPSKERGYLEKTIIAFKDSRLGIPKKPLVCCVFDYVLDRGESFENAIKIVENHGITISESELAYGKEYLVERLEDLLWERVEFDEIRKIYDLANWHISTDHLTGYASKCFFRHPIYMFSEGVKALRLAKSLNSELDIQNYKNTITKSIYNLETDVNAVIEGYRLFNCEIKDIKDLRDTLYWRYKKQLRDKNFRDPIIIANYLGLDKVELVKEIFNEIEEEPEERREILINRAVYDYDESNDKEGLLIFGSRLLVDGYFLHARWIYDLYGMEDRVKIIDEILSKQDR